MLKKYFIYFSFLLLSLCLVLKADPPPIPQIVVTGEALLKRPADEAVLRLGVTTESQFASSALEQNSKEMNALIETLSKVGLKESEFQTEQFSLYPLYTERPHDAKPDWAPKLRGYRVENKLTIRTQQISKLGSWIDAAVKAGANTIDDLSFGLKDSRAYREETIRVAALHAKEDAATLANSTGIRLGRVLNLTIDQSAVQPFIKTRMAYATHEFASPASTPISSGNVEVSARVTIIFEILQ